MIDKAVREHMAAMGRKGGRTTGPTKARDPEQARRAGRMRWTKRASEVQQQPCGDAREGEGEKE